LRKRVKYRERCKIAKTLRCCRFYDLVLLPVLVNPIYLGRRHSPIWRTEYKTKIQQTPCKMTNKLDGGDFKPDTLKSIKGIINRYLMGKHSIFNIIEDKEF
jgi:hypothetical protein